MKFSLEDKLFIMGLIFSLSWLGMIIFQKRLEIDITILNSIERVATLIIGAFVGAYAKKGEKNGKK